MMIIFINEIQNPQALKHTDEMKLFERIIDLKCKCFSACKNMSVTLLVSRYKHAREM
jgi:hypothetical protein